MAHASRCWKTGRDLLFLGLLVCPLVTAAAPAVRLIVTNDVCAVGPCPGNPPPPTTVPSGIPFVLAVVAVDITGMRDVGYTGTVNFMSTDVLASLPLSYTFVQADGGSKGFTATLRTPGSQTITATDLANGLSGSVTLTVTGQAPASVPTLSAGMKALLVLALALTGLWAARLTS